MKQVAEVLRTESTIQKGSKKYVIVRHFMGRRNLKEAIHSVIRNEVGKPAA